MIGKKCMHIDATDARKKMENVKNDAICHATRQNQYNPAGGGATKTYIGHQQAVYHTRSNLWVCICLISTRNVCLIHKNFINFEFQIMKINHNISSASVRNFV